MLSLPGRDATTPFRSLAPFLHLFSMVWELFCSRVHPRSAWISYLPSRLDVCSLALLPRSLQLESLAASLPIIVVFCESVLHWCCSNLCKKGASETLCVTKHRSLIISKLSYLYFSRNKWIARDMAILMNHEFLTIGFDSGQKCWCNFQQMSLKVINLILSYLKSELLIVFLRSGRRSMMMLLCMFRIVMLCKKLEFGIASFSRKLKNSDGLMHHAHLFLQRLRAVLYERCV